MIPAEYQENLEAVQRRLLDWLRAFERENEDIGFDAVAASQARLQTAAGDLFSTLAPQLVNMPPPEACADLHLALVTVLDYCSQAHQAYQKGAGATFSNAFLASRLFFGKALARLYAVRMELPLLETFWYMPDALADKAKIDPLFPRSDVPVGVCREPATADHSRYALYVPEAYDESKQWPLIVCLHGAYGTGEDYLWAWLRIARSHGYLVLSPKSFDVTWSVLQPPLDAASVEACIQEVTTRYRVDARRIFLTGLSDGATFSYLLAFSYPDRFAGVAPIAGELSPVADRMLRQKVANDVPFYVIHGAHDHIFPIETVRSTCGLLEHLGYPLKFDELPDWGHAYPYKINAERVFPWFESLALATDIEPES